MLNVLLGPVTIRYIITHVGHTMEVRTQRLSKSDQEYLSKQLIDGISIERIVKNARNVKTNDGEPSRLNLVSKNDLYNLHRRKNIGQLRHSNDMVATALKIEEWNANGKNYGFLFKQIGIYIFLYNSISLILKSILIFFESILFGTVI